MLIIKDFKFNVGDVVSVTSGMYEYQFYDSWFVNNGLKHLLNNYDGWMNFSGYLNETFQVVARGKHDVHVNLNLYAIKNLGNDKIHLIGEGGLKIKSSTVPVYSNFGLLELYHSTDYKKYRNPVGGYPIEIYGFEREYEPFNPEEVKQSIDLIYVNDKKQQVCIKWKDGTTTKATCQEGDEFDLSVGFAIALNRKLFKNDKKLNEFIDSKMVKEKKNKKKKIEDSVHSRILKELGVSLHNITTPQEKSKVKKID